MLKLIAVHRAAPQLGSAKAPTGRWLLRGLAQSWRAPTLRGLAQGWRAPTLCVYHVVLCREAWPQP